MWEDERDRGAYWSKLQQCTRKTKEFGLTSEVFAYINITPRAQLQVLSHSSTRFVQQAYTVILQRFEFSFTSLLWQKVYTRWQFEPQLSPLVQAKLSQVHCFITVLSVLLLPQRHEQKGKCSLTGMWEEMDMTLQECLPWGKSSSEIRQWDRYCGALSAASWPKLQLHCRRDRLKSELKHS